MNIKNSIQTERGAEILLIFVLVARSTSFVMSKVTMNAMNPFNLLGVRFLLAFLLLCIPFGKRLVKIKKQTLLKGLLVGLAFFCVMTAELFTLRLTASSTSSFLENMAIVFVPIFEAVLLHRLPAKYSVAGVLISMIGIGFLTLEGGRIVLGTGELIGILSGILYAVAIIITDRLSHNDDSLLIGMVQVGTIGALGMIASFLFEQPTLPQGQTSWLMVIYLAVVCTGFGFTRQPVAQSRLTAERAGLLIAVSPVSSAIMGSIFLKEHLGISGMIGAILVVGGIIISKDPFHKKPQVSS